MIKDTFAIIKASVRDFPDRIAIVTPESERISYRSLAATVEAYACRVAQAGIGKGQRVTLHNVSMTQYLLLTFALSRLGVVVVRMPDADMGGQAISIDRVIVDEASGLAGPKVVAMDLRWANDAPPGVSAPQPGFDSPDEIFLVIGTSGTTGQRKQVGLSLRVLEQRVQCQTTLGLCRQPRVLVHVPPTVAYGFQLCLLVLHLGGELHLPGHTPDATLAHMETGEIDEIIAPTALYGSWIQSLSGRDVSLKTIKRAGLTGSVSSKSMTDAIQRRICSNLYNHYGLTEVGPCALSRFDDVKAIEGAVGKLMDWVETRAINDHGGQARIGETGRIEFRLKPPIEKSPYVDDMLNPKPSDEWFATGDVGMVTEDRILCIFGRTGEMLNIGGNKIAPSSIEREAEYILGEAGSVCALGVPGPQGFDEAVLIVNARHAARLKDLPPALERAGLGLGRAHILALKDFPLNEFGKVDRLKLRAMVEKELLRRRAVSQPPGRA